MQQNEAGADPAVACLLGPLGFADENVVTDFDVVEWSLGWYR